MSDAIDLAAAEARLKAREQFLALMKGKTLGAAFKVGADLKAPAGLAPQTAQIAADAAKKGLAILDDNFNAAHQEGDGHAH